MNVRHFLNAVASFHFSFCFNNFLNEWKNKNNNNTTFLLSYFLFTDTLFPVFVLLWIQKDLTFVQ